MTVAPATTARRGRCSRGIQLRLGRSMTTNARACTRTTEDAARATSLCSTNSTMTMDDSSPNTRNINPTSTAWSMARRR
ncbi:MAG: hypothetical protein A4E29_01723 [Methanomassiliicoccales archaeon PtaB.Bin134]|nr:MAG: hypothetical protein A4E29_01723 [Methanomassiliicoccales archaeon PtaB.Bin134]